MTGSKKSPVQPDTSSPRYRTQAISGSLIWATACLTAVALTAATGALRMTSNQHWASDVIVGDLVGFASGYLLPTLVYYREFHIVPPPAEEQPGARPRIAVLPVAAPGVLELAAIGQF